jgi:hypothetical protein
MPRIDAVIFDFGNVLAMVDRAAICASLARHSPLPADEVFRRIWGTDIERLSETGAWTAQEHFDSICTAIEAYPDWTFEQFQEDFVRGFTPNPEGL